MLHSWCKKNISYIYIYVKGITRQVLPANLYLQIYIYIYVHAIYLFMYQRIGTREHSLITS